MPKSGAITIIRQSAPFRNAVGPSFLKIFLRDNMHLTFTNRSAAESKPAEWNKPENQKKDNADPSVKHPN
jgi:hypothetical protein